MVNNMRLLALNFDLDRSERSRRKSTQVLAIQCGKRLRLARAKQKTSLKSYKAEIIIHANPGLA